MIRVNKKMREGLLGMARAYAKAARLPLRTVSRRAYGDARFFLKISRGAAITGHAYDKLADWFGLPENWPNQTIPDGALADPFDKEIAP